MFPLLSAMYNFLDSRCLFILAAFLPRPRLSLTEWSCGPSRQLCAWDLSEGFAVLVKPGHGALEYQVTLSFLFFLKCWLVTGASESVENKAIFHIVRKTIVLSALWDDSPLDTYLIFCYNHKYLSRDYKFYTFIDDVWLFIQVFIVLWLSHAVSWLILCKLIRACSVPVSSLQEYLHLVFVGSVFWSP